MLSPALSMLREQLLRAQERRRLPDEGSFLLRELAMLDTLREAEPIMRSIVSGLPPGPVGSPDVCSVCGCDVDSCT